MCVYVGNSCRDYTRRSKRQNVWTLWPRKLWHNVRVFAVTDRQTTIVDDMTTTDHLHVGNNSITHFWYRCCRKAVRSSINKWASVTYDSLLHQSHPHNHRLRHTSMPVEHTLRFHKWTGRLGKILPWVRPRVLFLQMTPWMLFLQNTTLQRLQTGSVAAVTLTVIIDGQNNARHKLSAIAKK